LLLEYQFYPELFQATLKRLSANEGGLSLTQIEEAVMGTHHGMLSQLLCEKWKLPSGISMAVRYHHQPMAAPENDRSTSAVVFIANTIVRQAHFGFYYEVEEPFLDECLTLLNLEVVDLDVLREDFEQDIKDLTPFLT
jgi:HD-like signal output (HDOD) protein